jgi:hypothetical protein
VELFGREVNFMKRHKLSGDLMIISVFIGERVILSNKKSVGQTVVYGSCGESLEILN